MSLSAMLITTAPSDWALVLRMMSKRGRIAALAAQPIRPLQTDSRKKLTRSAAFIFIAMTILVRFSCSLVEDEIFKQSSAMNRSPLVNGRITRDHTYTRPESHHIFVNGMLLCFTKQFSGQSPLHQGYGILPHGTRWAFDINRAIFVQD